MLSTSCNNTSVTCATDQRLADIKYWETELDDKLEVLKTETDALIAFNTRLGKAMEGCKEPLYIAQQCLINRYVYSRSVHVEL